MIASRTSRWILVALLFGLSTPPVALAGLSIREIVRVKTDGTDLEEIVPHMDALARWSIAADSPEGLFWNGRFVSGSDCSLSLAIRRSGLLGDNITLIVSGGISDLAVDTVNDKLYFNVGDEATYRADLDGSNVEAGGPDIDTFGHIAVYPQGNLVCTTDGVVSGKIYCGDFEGPFEEIYEANTPLDIRIDWLAAKLYVLETDGIRRMNLDGSAVEEIVVPMFGVWNFALDPAGGRMWWTSAGNVVVGATLNGEGIHEVASIFCPQGIDFLAQPGDPSGGWLYVTADCIQVDLCDEVPATSMGGALLTALLIAASSVVLVLRRRRCRITN
jgi:hypothetical protein